MRLAASSRCLRGVSSDVSVVSLLQKQSNNKHIVIMITKAYKQQQYRLVMLKNNFK